MKTRVNLNGYALPDLRATPALLRAAYPEAVKHVASIMCLGGIRSITCTMSASGALGMVDWQHELFDTALPQQIRDISGRTAHHMAEYMVLFGIIAIELQPTAEELAAIAKGFKTMEGQADALASQDRVKTPPPVDPSGEAVTLELGNG